MSFIISLNLVVKIGYLAGFRQQSEMTNTTTHVRLVRSILSQFRMLPFMDLQTNITKPRIHCSLSQSAFTKGMIPLVVEQNVDVFYISIISPWRKFELLEASLFVGWKHLHSNSIAFLFKIEISCVREACLVTTRR